MPIRDPYSKRQQRLRGEFPDVYQYDTLSSKMRVQIMYILDDIDIHNGEIYEEISDVLSREYGLINLNYHVKDAYFKEAVLNFLERVVSIEYILDILEVAFCFVKEETLASELDYHTREDFEEALQDIDDAINELNQRFKEDGLGYQFEYPIIIRIDSQFNHKEVIKPALLLLSDDIYTNANEEFLKAHEHYRHNRYEEAIVEANKAFESVMKIIHNKKGWSLPDPTNASNLIKSLIRNKLLSESLSNYFTNFDNIITAVLQGLATVRNKNAGHGAGAEERVVPPYLASYALHLAATNIVFLIEAEKAMV